MTTEGHGAHPSPTFTASSLRKAIQPDADRFVRHASQMLGHKFRWCVDTTEAGTVYVSIWSPDNDSQDGWALEPDESGRWTLTVCPTEQVIANAASPALLLRNRLPSQGHVPS